MSGEYAVVTVRSDRGLFRSRQVFQKTVPLEHYDGALVAPNGCVFDFSKDALIVERQAEFYNEDGQLLAEAEDNSQSIFVKNGDTINISLRLDFPSSNGPTTGKPDITMAEAVYAARDGT